MMDFNERVIPDISSNFSFREAAARYEFILKYIEDGMKVVDLGSGTGYGAKILKRKQCKIFGIDISQDAVFFAKKRYGKYASFLKRSVTDTKFRRGQFDFACSFEVIEHLKNPKKFLKEVKRITKKDSLFVLSTPNIKISSPSGKFNSPYHEIEFDYNGLNNLLKSEFGTVKIFGQFHSQRAKKAWKDFMNSQKSRESFVKNDRFGLRKLLPKGLKERVWKYAGSLYGRKTQDTLTTKDFPIRSKNVKMANYFIAVCKK